MIKVVFFASVREQLGRGRVELAGEEIRTVHDVIMRLSENDPDHRQVFARQDLLVAVNQTMVDTTHPVASGDEVAIFPPVSGG